MSKVADHSTNKPAYLRIVCGQESDQFEIVVIVKRTYDIDPDGRCHLADQQEPVHDDAVPHEEVEPPRVSPPRFDNDCFAFKAATDLILQGAAYTYDSSRTQTTVELQVGDVHRAIRVHGDRQCEWVRGLLQFTAAAAFERMPIRYDRAYGGQDVVALERNGDEICDAFDSVRPEWQLSTTSPYHYPRNPSGVGYLIQADTESTVGLHVPNLEFPFDPITPERLAVKDVDGWMSGPLPACFDWSEQSWFPRIAYLGFVPSHHTPAQAVQEIQQGWATHDLLAQRSIFNFEFRPEFAQGASAGLAIHDFSPTSVVQIRNMFPKQADVAVYLPGEIPQTRVVPKWKDAIPLKPHLGSVVIRPDESQVVMTWSCRGLAERPFGEDELAEMPYECRWIT